MFCVSGNYDPRKGPIIDVSVSRNYDFKKSNNSNSLRRYKALLDTGASGTCVSIKVINDLSLKHVGFCDMRSASEANKKCRVFRAVVSFIFESSHQQKTIKANRYFGLDTLEANFEDKPYDLLIGTNIISRGVLLMKFNSFNFCL